MPEDVQQETAESSTAAPAATGQPDELTVPRDPEAYAEWRQTGKLPEKKPLKTKDDSAPSEKPSVKDAPASETGDERQEKRDKPEKRKEVLNREIRDLIARRDQLRQEVTTGPAKQDVKPEVKAEPSPAPAPEGPKRPVRPKLENFKNWDEFEVAQDKYIEDLADQKVAQQIENLQRSWSLQQRLNEAKARYGDEAETRIVATAHSVVDDPEVAVPIKVAVGRSKVMMDALYAIGTDEKELSEFVDLAKKDPLEALRKWYTFEALVNQELKKSKSGSEDNGTTPTRDADGKFVAAKPVRTAKEAPAPRTELGGNSSPPGDERARAADTGNFQAFKRDADRRDLARLRGQ